MQWHPCQYSECQFELVAIVREYQKCWWAIIGVFEYRHLGPIQKHAIVWSDNNSSSSSDVNSGNNNNNKIQRWVGCSI